MINFTQFLHDIAEETILYKNSAQYESRDWLPLKMITVANPVQRKLLANECVFDFDNIDEEKANLICAWLKDAQLKFIAFMSSPTGLHVHFFCDIFKQDQKKTLVRIMSRKIEELFNIKNDINPMNQQFIRSELSIHPKKNVTKRQIFCNINQIDYINFIPIELKNQLSESMEYVGASVSGSDKGLAPKCIKFITSNSFADGRMRLIFVLASWYIGSKKSKQETFTLLKTWCKKQNYNVSSSKLWATIACSEGRVGCRYRHELLEDLGFDVKCDGGLHR